MRKKVSIKEETSIVPRQPFYDYESRYQHADQMVKKKRVMSGREYEEFLRNQMDTSRKPVQIFRTSFVYEGQYFRLETITNIPGNVTFLRSETHQDEVTLPPFVPVEKEISDDVELET